MNLVSRRSFFFRTTIMLLLPVFLPLVGCASNKGKTSKKKQKGEFLNEEHVAASDEDQDVFESERKKQNELSEFLAKNGRTSKEKKSSVRHGDDFLLSDKAKEIYANTER